MSTTNKILYGTSNQAITCTLTSLANASAQCSAYVDNTANLYLDALVFVKVKTGSTGTLGNGTVLVYAYGTVDGGATYTDGMPGTNSPVSLPTPNCRLIGIINATANGTTYYGGPFSVALAFGGTLPQQWGLVIQNTTGGMLDASVGSAYFQGVYSQNV